MRMLYTLFTLAIGGFGLYWLTDKHPDLTHKAEELLDFRTTNALEIRYDAQQIMDAHNKDLLAEKGSRFLDPELKFFPYLLLEVKYLDTKNKTKESLILWDLNDGEMILDTKTWEKTHGFADCIMTRAAEHEFKILNILSNQNNQADTTILLSKLDVELPVLQIMLNSCMKKNLIISNGNNQYRIHLEKPKLTAIAQTKLHEQLTTRPHKRAHRAKPHFKSSQIQKIAKMAFGPAFSIRSATEIYLPIHRIIIQAPEGAIQTHHFNALNGTELPPAPFYQ